jgi:hypothetical protein
MVTVYQADPLSLGSSFDYLGGPFEFEILDQNNRVTIRKHRSVSVFHNACRRRRCLTRPLIPASHTFPTLFVGQNLRHCAFWTNWVSHNGLMYPKTKSNSIEPFPCNIEPTSFGILHGKKPIKCTIAASAIAQNPHEWHSEMLHASPSSRPQTTIRPFKD